MSAAPPGTPPEATGIESALGGVVIALIPAAFAYFIGWTYLYYYLLEFGIYISELDLGVEAVFMYAAPPILSLARTYWWLALAVVLVGFLVAAYRHLVLRFRLNPAFYARMRPFHPVAKGILWFLVLAGIVVVTAPLIQDIATQRANEKWTRSGSPVRAPVIEPATASLEYQDYGKCLTRRALELVFADKNVYYLLCVGTLDDDSGVVYEVRRAESKVASMRVSRRNPKGGKP